MWVINHQKKLTCRNYKTLTMQQTFTKKYSRYIGVLISIAFLWLLISYFSNIITWVVLAWVVSLLGSPIMALLGKLKIKNWQLPSSIRALVVLLLFYLGFGVFISFFAPVIVQQGRNLAEVDYAAIVKSLEEPIAHFNDWLIERGLSDAPLSSYALEANSPLDSTKVVSPSPRVTAPNNTIIQIDSLISIDHDSLSVTYVQLAVQVNLPAAPSVDSSETATATAPLEQLRKKAFQYISPSQIFTQTIFYTVNLFGSFLMLITSVTFIAFFFLKDEKLFGNGLNILIPNKHFKKTEQALLSIKKLLTRYFTGILLQVIVITVFLTTLLSLCGVPNSFLIGFFAAIINVIPYIGPLIGGLFAILVTISSNLEVDFYAVTLPMIYQVVGIFFTMQMLDGFVLQPYIFSTSVSAHPLEIFLIIIVGAQLGGAMGMVIAIPMYTIIRVIGAVFLQEFEIVQKVAGNINEDAPPDDS